MPAASPHVHADLNGPSSVDTERDPVCGMSVDPATASHRAEHRGHSYFFCGAKCREQFVAEPNRYLAPAPVNNKPPPTSHPGEGLWTCPMHPQIVRSEPGACPICGMSLEPMTPSGSEAENPELRDMTRRFWVGLVLSIPLLAMAMGEDVAKHTLDAVSAPRIAVWVQLALGTPAVLWCGRPFFERGWASLITGRLNMFSLIALGTGIAYAYSVVAALAPEIFPTSFRGPDGEVPLYFEAAAVIRTLVLLGQVLELRARSATDSASREA